MSIEQADFEAFMKQRIAAADSYVNGNGKPLDAIASRLEPVTFMPPSGGVQRGAGHVAERYLHDAGRFDEGSTNAIEVLQMNADGDIAFWTGFQRSKVKMKGKDEAMPFDLRITELYRREDGAWKLVHRHADPLANEKK